MALLQLKSMNYNVADYRIPKVNHFKKIIDTQKVSCKNVKTSIKWWKITFLTVLCKWLLLQLKQRYAALTVLAFYSVMKSDSMEVTWGKKTFLWYFEFVLWDLDLVLRDLNFFARSRKSNRAVSVCLRRAIKIWLQFLILPAGGNRTTLKIKA